MKRQDSYDLLDSFDLPEEQDDKFKVIPVSDYIPEVEEKVKFYLSRSHTWEQNTIKYKRVEIPEFESKNEQELWEKEEIRRCKKGHDGMAGKMYFFFHYCKIKRLGGGGRISPDFRVVDNEWFKLIEACQKSNEWGIICTKRRRVGASWKEAADALHDVIFTPFFQIGMNSKTERDSIELFSKVKFLYDSLPAFLKVKATSSNTQNFLEFAYHTKDEKGNKIKRGNQSWIRAVAPTSSAYEGLMLNKWICDEAGKISNLNAMWSYTEDCLMQETRRVGMPIIFGTSGDVGAEGKDLKDMWKNAGVYKLKRFFFAGWMGLNCDEFGNDNKEDCIRWILYQRHYKSSLTAQEQRTYIQKYPLTVAEAFAHTSGHGVGDRMKIQAQMDSLFENPAEKRTGRMKVDAQHNPVFSPDTLGKIIIYEHPKLGLKNLYFAGCDPSDHDKEHEEQSDLSLFIMKKADGLEPPQIVCEYTDRPEKAVEFYEQALLLLLYYNHCKVLIERNRYGMISHFDQVGYKYLLATTPVSITRLFGGRPNTLGLNMTPAHKEYLKGLIEEYVQFYCEFIPSEDLLDEFLHFGARNTDKAMAFGIALIYMKEDKTVASVKNTKRIPSFGYRQVNGKILRYETKLSD